MGGVPLYTCIERRRGFCSVECSCFRFQRAAFWGQDLRVQCLRFLKDGGMPGVQGYLAHKKQPHLLGPPWGPRYPYCRVLRGGCSLSARNSFRILGRGSSGSGFEVSSGRRNSRGTKQFRGGLVFKAHRLLCHSTLGSSVTKEKKK